MQSFFKVKPAAKLWPPPFFRYPFLFKVCIMSAALIPSMLLIEPFKLFFYKLTIMLGKLYSLVSLLAIIPIIPWCQLWS